VAKSAVTLLRDLPSASGILHGLFTVQNAGNLEQFCCKNQIERQQNKLFLGRTIVVNSINSISVIRSSGLMGGKAVREGFGTQGGKRRGDKLGETIITWKHAREICS